jgi:hypothetical protein
MNRSKLTIRPYGRAYTVVRILLGLIFVLNSPIGVFDRSALAMLGENNILMQLWNLGYLMYVVKVLELLVGIALLSNRFVPLALIVIAPIIANIILAQAMLPGIGPVLGLVLAGLAGYLALAHWESYHHLFSSRPAYAVAPLDKARPDGSAVSAG